MVSSELSRRGEAPDRARALAERALVGGLPLADDTFEAYLMAVQTLVSLDDLEVAARLSVGVLAPSPVRLELARSLIELGAALRRANRRAEARDFLHEGQGLANRCGGAPLAERAHQELIATGARPRRLARAGVDALTPSERRVARMAADGQTNREIAQALLVTPKTIEMHLSNVYRKLDLQARSQLAGALAKR